MSMWKEQILARAIRIQKENWGAHEFFRDNRAQVWKEIALHSLYFNAFLELWFLNYLSKCAVTHIFLSGFQ